MLFSPVKWVVLYLIFYFPSLSLWVYSGRIWLYYFLLFKLFTIEKRIFIAKYLNLHHCDFISGDPSEEMCFLVTSRAEHWFIRSIFCRKKEIFVQFFLIMVIEKDLCKILSNFFEYFGNSVSRKPCVKCWAYLNFGIQLPVSHKTLCGSIWNFIKIFSSFSSN